MRALIIIVVLAFLGFLLTPLIRCRERPAGMREETGGSETYYRIPIPSNPPTLDPARATDTISDGIVSRIFGKLLKHDSKLRIVGDLAEEWTISEDGTKYRFKLRRGVKFHNGDELRASDVVASFNRLLDPVRSKRSWVLEPVRGASEVISGRAKMASGIIQSGEYEVIIELEHPFAPFPEHLTMGCTGIVPASEGKRKDFGKRPVGTGAFRFVEWRDNSFVTLKRFDGYFRGAAKIAGIRYRVIPRPEIRIEEYRVGNLEHCDVPPGRLEEIRSSVLSSDLATYPVFTTGYVGIQMELPPWGKNVHLRRALNYAIDREYLCRVLLEGTHVPARGVLPPGFPGYSPDLRSYTFDPAKAAEELSKAGYPNGAGLPRIKLYFRNDEDSRLTAQRIQIDLKRISVATELRPMEWAVFLDAIDSGSIPFFRLGWVADYADPDNFLYILFHSSQFGSAGNHCRYSNPELDRILEQARSTIARAERMELYARAEHLIIADAPWVFLTHNANTLLINPRVRGLKEQLTGLDSGANLSQVDFTALSLVE